MRACVCVCVCMCVCVKHSEGKKAERERTMGVVAARVGPAKAEDSGSVMRPNFVSFSSLFNQSMTMTAHTHTHIHTHIHTNTYIHTHTGKNEKKRKKKREIRREESGDSKRTHVFVYSDSCTYTHEAQMDG